MGTGASGPVFQLIRDALVFIFLVIAASGNELGPVKRWLWAVGGFFITSVKIIFQMHIVLFLDFRERTFQRIKNYG